MAQNRSSAVMSQRIEAQDSLDDYPTPSWAGRSFVEWLKPGSGLTAWEPAANRGFLARGLEDGFETVMCSDVADYGVGFPIEDFLFPGPPPFSADWVITNPPFRLAMDFVLRGLDVAKVGVAVIVRSNWAEGGKRYERLFSKHPPSWIVQHVERVPMVRGRYDPDASTATGYSWFVWHKDPPHDGTRFDWIPVCKTRLYRPGDEIIPLRFPGGIA